MQGGYENDPDKEDQDGDESGFCATCNEYKINEIYKMSTAPVNDGPSKLLYDVFEYGTVLEIQEQSADCPFCNIVSQLFPKDISVQTEIDIRSTYHPYSEYPRFFIWTKNIYHESRRFFGSIHFNEKDVEPNRDAQIRQLSPSLVTKWIKDCETDHDHSLTQAFVREKFSIDLVLIDVRENRLVKATSSERYFALSYVWGGINMSLMNSRNRRSLEEEGALFSANFSPPPLIRDAITFVRQLGEKFLWVDALCIEQDNSSQKHSQIAQMDIIYSQAVATIVALSGLSAASSLPGVSPDTRLASSIEGSINGIPWRVVPPRFEQSVLNSEYETRAWTYQERILSKRCLFFTNHNVWFHCRIGQCNDVNESTRMGTGNSDIEFNKLSVLPLLEGEYDWAIVLQTYGSMVIEYTRRQLTYPSDTLNALSGILALYRHLIGCDTPEGLLEKYLDLCLLWVNSFESALGVDPKRNPHFSSWSWTGWTGASGYKGGPIYPWMTDETINDPVPIMSAIERIECSYQTPKRSLRRHLSELHVQPEDNQVIATAIPDRAKGILFFETEVVSLDHFSPNWFKNVEYRVRQSRQLPHLSTCNPTIQMFNRQGHHCGAVLSSLNGMIDTYDPTFCEYILLSRSDYPARYDQATHTWETDPCAGAVFDHAVFPTSQWCILNIMLIVWIGDVAERITLCQIHADAWKQAMPKRKKIALG